ncbi:reactive intermediate/imine deaminase [Campylobacter blaseri]|uniref:Deaminase n=1 Tax=Campylobacter blaseri TaxID=2042961 RepID=A0A2P8R0H6_9BACT|nr:RidA family protein [Campylobacter blaseri]PSM51991.1 deaminase [Campylobacter blaseri]PSM53776.1 deaminase [Campylobacter blaseri]QKF85670.1 reactive intermediate/imine deaminase [Campylobacter blaseri]
MKKIETKNAPVALGPYSQAIKVGDFLFTSGQIGLKVDGEFAGSSIEEQTKQAMENLKAILEVKNLTFEDVIKTTIFLADMNDFAKVNEIYGSYFGEHKPARSTFAVNALPKNALVEIELIAKI